MSLAAPDSRSVVPTDFEFSLCIDVKLDAQQSENLLTFFLGSFPFDQP